MDTIKKLILIIEDEEALARALSMKLDSEGFQSLTAIDGEAGLEMAFAKKPDLILLDILMPKMDGWTLLKQLRKDTWGSTAHVMVLTNFSSNPSELASALENGVTDYLIKTDLSLSEIVKKVRQKLE